MALFYHGHKLTDLAVHDKMIATLEHQGHTIYRHRLATGYVLWEGPNGFISNYDDLELNRFHVTENSLLLVNQTLPLNQPITKLRTGIIFNFAPKALEGDFMVYDASWSQTDLNWVSVGTTIDTAQISLTDLVSRKAVKVATGDFFDLYAKAVDDTHIQFYNQQLNGAQNYQNSTMVGWDDNGDQNAFRSFLIVNSVTAY